MTIQAWHFLKENRLRTGEESPADGVSLVYDRPLSLCASGLHASEDILDALGYAPGFTLCRVSCGGTVVKSDDKLVCSWRVIQWRIDARVMRRVLFWFAYSCAERAKEYANAADASASAASAANAADAAAYAADAYAADAYAANAAASASAAYAANAAARKKERDIQREELLRFIELARQAL